MRAFLIFLRLLAYLIEHYLEFTNVLSCRLAFFESMAAIIFQFVKSAILYHLQYIETLDIGAYLQKY